MRGIGGSDGKKMRWASWLLRRNLRPTASDQFQTQLASYRSRSPLQGVQGDTGVVGIEQPVERASAGLHAGRHGRLGEPILFHCGLDLIGEDLLDGLFLALPENSLFRKESVERRTNLPLFLESHLAHLLLAPEREFQIPR